MVVEASMGGTRWYPGEEERERKGRGEESARNARGHKNEDVEGTGREICEYAVPCSLLLLPLPAPAPAPCSCSVVSLYLVVSSPQTSLLLSLVLQYVYDLSEALAEAWKHVLEQPESKTS
eukprot:19804-Hanusia_phi.AAC.1